MSNNKQNTSEYPLDGAGFSQKIQNLSEQEAKLKIEKDILLRKAIASEDVDAIFKAHQYAELNSPQRQNTQVKGLQAKEDIPIKSIMVDPMDLSSSMGYKDRAFSLSYDVLRGMSRTHIIKSIIETRKTQVSAYCQPQADKYSPGFVIQPRVKYTQLNNHEEITSAQKAKIDFLVEFLLNGGTIDNFWESDSFDTFVAKLVSDSLTLDQACAEIVRDNNGLPCEFKAIDAATIRKIDTGAPDFEATHDKIKGYYPSLMQVIDSRPVNEYYPWEMMFGVRNPSTDIKTNGYGRSELEDMIQTVTALLNSDFYNANFFKVGSAPKGILKYKGDINMNVVEQFKSQWVANTAGVHNMHKMPIINADSLDFVNLQQSNKDMEFSKYQEFLIKISCALYKIDPSEIGFPMAGASETSAFGGSVGNAEKLKYSKDKGLKPLLRYIERWVNKYIIWQIDPSYEFRFVGLDDATTFSEELDYVVKEMSNYKTLNEVRKQMGLKAIPGGDIICNPIYFQKYMADMQAEMQQQQGGNPYDQMFGEEENNEDGGEGMQEEEQHPLDDESNPLAKAFLNEIGTMLCKEETIRQN